MLKVAGMVVKKTKYLIAFLCAFAFLMAWTPVFSAQELSVQKALKTSDISVGDNVEIILKFENPFGKQIPIKIIDKNILGGNGVDIQCMEYTIPEQKSVDVSYPAIQAFESGDFTLDPVTITYTNPETGKEENITSKEIEVSIKKSAAAQNIQQQGITTVYQCNGVSMQSTSYSSSGSSQNQQNQNQNNQQNPQSQQQQAQNQMQDKVNSMQQQNQNMNQIKQEMQERAQKEEQAKQDLMKKAESNPEFQKQDQELKKQGYQQSSKSASPEQSQNGESNPNEGSFDYQYKKENGETASIKGDMQNGTVQNLQKWSSEDEKNAAIGIENSSQFKKIEEELKKQGFQLQNKSITPDAEKQQSPNSFQGNSTQSNLTKTAASFQYSYANPGTNATASINGNATILGNTTNVTKINLEKTEEKNNRLWYGLLALLIIAAAVYLYYKKTRKVPVVAAVVKGKKTKPLDYRKKARQMIEEGELLFADGLQKEAYVKVSRAVRFYFKHRFDRTEMTSSDILRAIAGEDAEYVKNVRDCFSICDLVNFAKYEPNARDFGKVAGLAKGSVI